MAKEEYDTLKAWGLDKPQTRGNKERAEYWESMAKSLNLPNNSINIGSIFFINSST